MSAKEFKKNPFAQKRVWAMSEGNYVEPNDLFTAVEAALKSSGAYKKIKAQIRANVYHALEDKTVALPTLPAEVFLASELIKDFLGKLKLNHTMSVFCEEMGLDGPLAVDRQLVGQELGLDAAGVEDKLPLLLVLISFLQKQKVDYMEQVASSLAVELDQDEEGGSK